MQTTFSYDADHMRTQTNYPNGVSMFFTYDQSNRLTRVLGKKPASGEVLTDFLYSWTNGSGQDTGLRQSVTDKAGSVNFVDPAGTFSFNPVDWVKAAKRYLKENRWARCALFAVGSVGLLGEAVLVIRAVRAARRARTDCRDEGSPRAWREGRYDRSSPDCGRCPYRWLYR